MLEIKTKMWEVEMTNKRLGELIKELEEEVNRKTDFWSYITIASGDGICVGNIDADLVPLSEMIEANRWDYRFFQENAI